MLIFQRDFLVKCFVYMYVLKNPRESCISVMLNSFFCIALGLKHSWWYLDALTNSRPIN